MGCSPQSLPDSILLDEEGHIKLTGEWGALSFLICLHYPLAMIMDGN